MLFKMLKIIRGEHKRRSAPAVKERLLKLGEGLLRFLSLSLGLLKGTSRKPRRGAQLRL
jgi:hypothetical protein